MASVVGPFRYCMRHPTRMLLILLLLVLVVASRFLFSSIPQQRNIHALNLMSGTLSQQLGSKTKPSSRLDSDDKNSLEETRASKGRENDLSPQKSEGYKKSRENEVQGRILTVDNENSENNLGHDHRKIYHSDRGAGKKVALRKTAKGEIGIHHEHDNMMKNGSRKRKPNHQPKLKQGPQPSQEYNVLMVLAKVGQTSQLAQRFKRCLLSICMQSTVNLGFYVLADEVGRLTCQGALSQARKVCKIEIKVTYYDVKRVAERVRPIVKDIQVIYSIMLASNAVGFS